MASLPMWAALLVLATLPGPALADEQGLLQPGTAPEVAIRSGEEHSYRLAPGGARRWLITAEQLGADVELKLEAGQHGNLVVDGPFDREGSELLLLPEGVAAANLVVRCKPGAAAAARYRLRLDAVEGSERLAALSAASAAGQGYAAENAAGRQRALVESERAGLFFAQLGERPLAAQYLYAAAVLERLLGGGAAAPAKSRQVLPLWQALGDTGRVADTWNEIGLAATAAKNSAEARAAYERAMAAAIAAGDLFRQAAIGSNLCLTLLSAGDLKGGLSCYEKTLPRIRAAGDSESEAAALINLGRAHDLLGEPDAAFASFEAALALHRAAGRRRGEAEVLNYLGLLHRQLGEPQQAVEAYLEALEVFHDIGDRRREARSLHNLARAYLSLGDPERALALGRRALELREALGEPLATSLKSLGAIELAAGRSGAARELFVRAVELDRASGDHAGEAAGLGWLGRADLALGAPALALQSFEQALELARVLGEKRSEGAMLLGRGAAQKALLKLEAARESLLAALERLRTSGARDGEVEAQYLLAQVEKAAGRSTAALVHADRAMVGLEGLRAELGDPDAMAMFSGDRQGIYQLRIELLMEGHLARKEEQVFLRRAFETSARSRAAGWAALLGDGEVTTAQSRAAADSSLAALEEGRLRARRLFAVAARRYRKEPAARGAEAELLHRLGELEKIEAELRRRGSIDPAPKRPLRTREIQHLLGDGTLWLELVLGDERSYLFVLSKQKLRAVELPPRAELEAAARAFRESLATRASGYLNAPSQAGEEISRRLLAPALEGRESGRLVVASAGAFDYLPFAALPLPGSAESVLTRFEVVHLASAEVLAATRRRASRQGEAPKWAAIFADPVFDRRDLRLPPGDPAAPAPPSRDSELPRLFGSRQEARAIAALAPSEEVLLALDFDASRELAESGRLEDYRIVHFATHAVIDPRYPALSGLALSFFDPRGLPREGFLRLRDIAALRLRADLVVLSACRSALGKEVPGEGFLGLARAFFAAGARRVLASLWSVDDHSTAELMTYFYRAMLKEKLTPAAALRRAQLELRRQPRYRDPYYWAGFVLVGDWQ